VTKYKGDVVEILKKIIDDYDNLLIIIDV